MEAYMAASAKSQVSSAECNQRLKPDEIAQVKNDFRQNNAHLNQLSFIPVYSSKSMCHKFPKSKNECESPPSERKVLTTYSPPSRPRVLGNNDMITSRFGKTHMRRRSVGFEDMTSSACFGHNFTNDRRFQGSGHNSNIPQSSTENHSLFYNSRNSPPSLRKLNQSENRFSLNHNSQLPGDNANDQLHRTERPLQRYKDKSSKRKSSLNRIDFIQFPSLNAGSAQFHADQSQQRNSSSDEDSESRLNAKALESPSSTSKRKHSASSSSHATSRLEMKTNEITLGSNSPCKVKSNLLPRSSQTGLSHPRQTRWKHPAGIRFSQKLSHSAGELESLTDLSEVPSRNKTYLSAQECDDPESSSISFNSGGVITRNSIQKLLPRYLSKNDSLTSKNNTCDNASQGDAKRELANNVEHHKHNDSNDLVSLKLDCCDNSQLVDQKGNISSETYSEQINISSEHCNSNLKISCDDSKEFNDPDVQSSAVKLKSLEITENSSSSSKSIDIYLSADENGEAVNSDGERRPSSILRKKSFEEKKELHSILKPTPDEKFSKAPLSILKHRESSEEKEIWQSNDLHSILKKSTSEDESCNSGTDIRPILKLSTDEDSPSGSLRPRPILKKRTSFSDECSYVSYPSGELKPILKKKTPLSLEEQPKPILKSRRKSEDTRSTTSEVITSRPRAYSADMGVKISHENQSDNLEVKEDFRKLNSHDL